MFIPIGTDRPLKRPTVTTIGLVVVTVVAFLAQTALIGPTLGGRSGAAFVDHLVLDPLAPRWWAFFTYQFLHGGLLHLAGNMLFLWVFGPPVEDKFGRWGFLAFYLIGGAFAGLVHTVVEPNPVIGASGSIACVTGAFMTMFPRVTIKVLSLLFIIGMFHIPALWFVLLAISWDLFLPRSGVAVWAHLGGYAFGISVTMALLGLRWISREPFDLVTMGRQAHRRRVFREATARDGSAFQRDAAERMRRESDPKALQISAARSRVSEAVQSGDAARAGEAYRSLLEQTSDGALGRPAQLALGNLLYSAGDSDGAVAAYEHFLKRYPADPESARVRLMLALLHARSLNDPIRAKALVVEAMPGLKTEDERGLARELLEELG